MFLFLLVIGALTAAPLFPQTPSADPQVRKGRVSWFSLTEKRADVLKRLGPPDSVADFGQDYQSWTYRIGNEDRHENSHYFVFRRSADKLISVTRAYEREQRLDKLFSGTETSVYYHNDLHSGKYGARVRRLSQHRVLIAMGSVLPDQPVGQLILIDVGELRHFHPWLYVQLTNSAPPHHN